ncbi:MAG: cysteine--tRNA ligase [Clostridiales bacterium]|nr:cysteine--tRNA ligase [Clostridiales bacterium]
MRVYNTLSKKKEEFVTLEPGKVKMYVCGPTVYNLIHIGNARPMIVFDTARRYLEHKGYEVNYVSNFTDVDDKIIAKANEEGVSSQEISERYIAECQKDMEALNVRPATTHPRATQEIDGMIDMIQTLMDKGYAYDVDGTVYFRTRKFKEYGKLSHKNLDDLRSGGRSLLVTGEDQKEDPLDFVLWKPKKEGEPSWPSPWSDGRPGWHIECSVMSKKYLGEEIDIHAGGEDLIFPHHENEIAQSECCNGRPFAKYWLHNAFLNIDNRKMSKSLGNFFTVREILEKYDAQVLRFFMLSAHYRSPLNFSADLMDAAKNALERIQNAVSNLSYLAENASATNQETSGAETTSASGKAASDMEKTIASGKAASDMEKTIASGKTASDTADMQTEAGLGLSVSEQEILAGAKAFEAKFDEAMDDDFNTADAIAAVFELVKYANSNLSSGNSKELIQEVREEIVGLCGILGLIVEEKEELLDADVEALIAERQAARKARNFARADEIRDQLAAQGITLLDTREGVKWKRA